MGFRKRVAVLVATSVLAGTAWAVIGAAPAAGFVRVHDEIAFRRAWTNPHEKEIWLGADITLSDCRAGVPVRYATNTMTVTGNGHTIRQTCRGRGVLEQQGPGPLVFDGVTITGGDNTSPGGPASTGGGIRDVNGPVTMVNSTVTGNNSSGFGGGIAAMGGVTLTNSTVSGNTSVLGGGGISTTSVNLRNSTVSGNVSSGGGGGILAGGSVTLAYGTVVENSAPSAANVSVSGTLTSLASIASVIAVPTGGGTNCTFGPGSTTSSLGSNFSDDASCGLTAAGDVQNGGNPRLGPLAKNGGPTLTRLPLGGSPLIDAFPPSLLYGCWFAATDQRGVSRPQGFGCDIGAVDVARPPD